MGSMGLLFKDIILNSIIVSIMVTFVLVIRLLFSNKIHPKMINFLWFLVLIKLCIPVSISVPFNIGDILPNTQIYETSINYDHSFSKQYENATIIKQDDIVQQSNSSLSTQFIKPTSNNQDEETKYLNSITVWDVFSLIWIIGIIVFFIWITITNILFSRKVGKHAKPFLNTNTLSMIDEYKKVLNVNRKIHVLSYPYIATPLVYGCFKIKILFPVNFNHIYDGKMDGVIVHELTHIKRHDVFIAYCWMVVKAVYWFNPLVWIANSVQKKDAELTCDYKTIKAISKRKRLCYGEALILSARFIKKQFISNTAVSFQSGKSNIGRRINMIISPKKLSKKVTAISILLITIMVITCFTTACQPTPEKDIVQGKNEGIMESAILEGVENEGATGQNTQTVEAPETYKNSFSKNNVTVNINAEVQVPGIAQYPALSTRYRDFTQDDVDRMAAVIIPPGSEIIGIEDVLTKPEIDEQIIGMRAQINQVKELSPDQFKNRFDEGDTEESVIKEYEERIKQLESMYNDAPEEEPENTATTQLIKDENGTHVELMIENEDNSDSMLFCVVNNSMLYGEGKQALGETYTHNDSSVLNTTLEEAEDQAFQFLLDMGIDNMVIANSGLGTIENHRYNESQNGDAYIIEFSRIVQGDSAIASIEPAQPRDSVRSADTNFYIDEDGGEYANEVAEEIEQEEIVVALNDSGIILFSYDHAMDRFETVTSNVELISWDEIIPMAENNMFYKTYVEDSYTMEINIEKIVLGYMCIAKKDDIGTMLIIPVWDFIGTSQYTDESGRTTGNNAQKSYLTMNAIDGSIIDRSLGY